MSNLTHTFDEDGEIRRGVSSTLETARQRLAFLIEDFEVISRRLDEAPGDGQAMAEVLSTERLARSISDDMADYVLAHFETTLGLEEIIDTDPLDS